MLPSTPAFARDDDESIADDDVAHKEPVVLIVQRMIVALRVRAGFSFSSVRLVV